MVIVSGLSVLVIFILYKQGLLTILVISNGSNICVTSEQTLDVTIKLLEVVIRCLLNFPMTLSFHICTFYTYNKTTDKT